MTNQPIDVLTKDLQKNLQHLKTILNRSSDIIYREFQINGKYHGAVIFLDGFINIKLIDEDVLKPLMNYGISISEQSDNFLNELETILKNQVISAAQVSNGHIVEEIIGYILSGDTVLMVDGVDQALIISAREFEKRAVDEPATEAVIRGPREGFTENLGTNISQIRRRLKHPSLKMEAMKVGVLSNTNIVISYLDGIADNSLVEEVKERIKRINIDAILESEYIEELIEDNPYSVFPQLLSTERPDRVVAHLLEGKIGIIIDNTPFALIAPTTFFEMMSSSEDYYQRYIAASLLRWLRFLFLINVLLLPALYIAVTTYHHEMLPTALLYSVAASRENVPFPALLEALLMEISFEGLREAGVRLPRPVGPAVSIVGALVVGQAAVQAGLVSAPLVIVVSITGIASFIIPNFSQGLAIRILRFPLMLLAGTLGLYGVLMGLLFIMIHMAGLRSFGVPYLSPLSPLHISDLKDTLIRVSWRDMFKRPKQTSKKNPLRMRKRPRF